MKTIYMIGMGKHEFSLCSYDGYFLTREDALAWIEKRKKVDKCIFERDRATFPEYYSNGDDECYLEEYYVIPVGPNIMVGICEPLS